MARDRSALPYFVRAGILFLLLTSFCYTPTLWAAEPAYAPDQLIVQYKAGKTPKDTTLLNAQYGVKKTERVFKLLETLGKSQGKPVLTTKEFLNYVKTLYPQRAQRAPATTTTTPRLEDIYLLQLQSGTNVLQAVADYRKNTNVSYAEPNYVYRPSFTPNDPFWGTSNTWHLTKIKADKGWDKTKGAGTIIAVVDSGIDAAHPDVIANLWTNPNETANGLDDDGNSIVDDLRGVDYYGTGLPSFVPDGNPNDVTGHGTHVAGLAAAVGNNNIGTLGVAWQARIMAIKSCEGLCFAATTVAPGILYANAKGADVINMSIGGPSSNQAEADALALARAAGIVLVAATGNDGSSNVDYPARYEGVIGVGATEANDSVANFSNYGPDVDLVAPGVGITSLWPSGAMSSCPSVVSGGGSGTYCSDTGTSMAAPQVAGAVALLLTQDPLLSLLSVEDVLKLTADDIETPGPDDKSGAGRLNVDKALTVGALLLDKGPNN